MTARIASRARMSGLSLIELMVAMVIGLIVVGIGASSFLNVAVNSRSVSALTQMTTDAGIALGILRNHVALAGYSKPIGVSKVDDTSSMIRAFKGGRTSAGDENNFIVGCDGGFQDNRAHELNISLLECNPQSDTATTPAPDAVAIVYEAETDNTYPSGNEPTDCLGNAVPAHTYLPNQPRIASNKFYIHDNRSGLYCQGNGRDATPADADDTLPAGLAPQMIVENITDMQIQYGLAQSTTKGTETTIGTEAIAYLDADQIRGLSDANKWRRVVSARICVEVRSAIQVNRSEQTSYLNCLGNVVANNTGRLVRTFSTTVVLHNRAYRGEAL